MFTAMPFLLDAPPEHPNPPAPTRSDQHRSAEEKTEPVTDDVRDSAQQQASSTNPASDDAATAAEPVTNEATQTAASDSESEESRDRRHQPPPEFPVAFGLIFICVGVLGLLIGFTYALAQVLAGRFIAKRKRRTFCMIVAGLNCLNIPMGLILGVFTIIVLVRPSVKLLFEQNADQDADPFVNSACK